ncbi:MAG: hypothetical protein ACREQ8_17945 [Woeseiaceae bacterium]
MVIVGDRTDENRTFEGRFRAFLLGALTLFVNAARDRARARKRGGDRQFVTLDMSQDFSSLPPDVAFDHGWALTLLARAMSRLKEEYAAKARSALVELAPFLSATSWSTITSWGASHHAAMT